MIKNIYLGFKFAFSYFSILPVKLDNQDLTQANIIKSFLFFFPFVGFILGYIIIILYQIMSTFSWLSAISISILYMILYGFLHTEAVIDTVDALYAKHHQKSQEEVYKIIKEPTVGAMGVLYGVSFMILKISTLSYLLHKHLFIYLLIIFTFSRISLIINIKYFNIHKKSSFINIMKNNISQKLLILILLIYSLICKNLFLISMILLISFFLTYIINKKLNFVNGDVLGFSLEMTELISMFIIIFLGI